MPRKARIDDLGGLYHIMVGGIERRRMFSDDQERNNSPLLPVSVSLSTPPTTDCNAALLRRVFVAISETHLCL
jgi:hypothetical protein